VWNGETNLNVWLRNNTRREDGGESKRQADFPALFSQWLRLSVGGFEPALEPDCSDSGDCPKEEKRLFYYQVSTLRLILFTFKTMGIE